MEGVILNSFDEAFLNYINGEHDKLTDKQKEIFCENRTPIDNKNITLRGLCAGLGIEVPEKFEEIADEKQTVSFRCTQTRKGDVCIILRSAEDFEMNSMTSKDQYEAAINKGAKLIIMDKVSFEAYELKEEDFPVILVEDYNERIYRFFSIMREQQKAKVIQITGSVGKTTTKNICHTVVKNRFKTFANTRNTNTAHRTAQYMFHKTNSDNEVHMQETGAGFRGSVRMASAMLQPDIFILTNVYPHHLQMYKTMENLFADKTSADDYLAKDGVIITNFDEENLRNHQFKHKVVSFAIRNEDVDFRAINIRQVRDRLTFDVFERETGKTTEVTVKILGEHNVYNILAAFALAKTLGVSEELIQDDLSEYRPEGIRQNLSYIGGRYLYLDCYNAAEESILAMLKSGKDFPLESGSKKYAVIGGENKLGKDVRTRSFAFGEQLAHKCDVEKEIEMDEILFHAVKEKDRKSINHYGDARNIYKGFKDLSKVPCSLATSLEGVEKFLRTKVKRNDLVMLKGLYYLDMPICVDRVFGTSYSFDLAHYIDEMVTVEEKGFKANLIPKFAQLELTSGQIKNGKLSIPKKLKGHPVFRIKNKSFRNKKDLVEVNLGKSTQNVGERAFAKCGNLKKVVVPANVKVIEDRCFFECSNLETVVLKEGLTHIGERAFDKCKNLKEMYIPESVGMIEKNAFRGCESVSFNCVENSFAHTYAVENNISYKLVKARTPKLKFKKVNVKKVLKKLLKRK